MPLPIAIYPKLFKMQKSSNPSKKNTVSAGHALSEQYRSEGSRGSLSGVKPKDGIAMQNVYHPFMPA
jgi:hypothetical protein